MNNIEVSVVMPCLNESKTIEQCIAKAKSALKQINKAGEIIVVDNCSTDPSAEIARQAGARVVIEARKGYGYALRAGFAQAQGKYVVFGDADDSYDFSEIPKFVELLEAGDDYVIGSRLRGRIVPGAMPLTHRLIGTPILSKILNLFFKTNISDCNCGMRALRKTALDKMQLSSEGMELASEMVLKASQNGIKIKEIPITLQPTHKDRQPHLRPLKDGWRHLKMIFLFSPTHLFIFPALFLMVLGLFGLFAATRIISVFGHQLQSHFVIIGGLFTLLGFQVFLLGINVKAYVFRFKVGVVGPVLSKYFDGFKLEKHLFWGGALFLIGLSANIYIMVEWLRTIGQVFVMHDLAVISSTVMVAGIQIIFSAFYLSFILEHNRYD